LFELGDEEVYLEVKSAVLRDGWHAMYPDCPTVRGRRHIRGLTEYAHRGGKAFVVFIAALPRVSAFRPNRHADPELYELLVDARRAGVGVKALNIIYKPGESAVYLVNPDLPVEMCA
jgi:sugar fermentation stimulation protein A